VTVRDLPALNATLNAASAVLLLLGYLAIRRRARETHRRFMIAALATSATFLVSYLVYHFQVGSVPFRGQGGLRLAYFTILLSHTVLAVAIVPLVLVTLVRALRERFDAHRRIARLTLPLWSYVSVTGVVIYWMLYRL
jgi:uncharacterized membrane protein YozB (DUF420 family)